MKRRGCRGEGVEERVKKRGCRGEGEKNRCRDGGEERRRR